MRTGLLRGRDHTLIGSVATLSERRVAIALSRGGAEKNYGHRDPNEDACCFAFTEHAWLVAVADGHWGSRGAELALERLLERHAPRWTSPSAIALADRWFLEAPEVVSDLNRVLLSAGDERDTPGRTTLALALVRPRDGWWAGLLMGDSHLFTADDATVREPHPAKSDEVEFVGDARLDRTAIERGLRCAFEPSAPRGAIVLATDGLSEAGIGVDKPSRAVADSLAAARETSGDLRPLAAARRLAELALEAQRRNRAGDNVSTACIWLGD
jgi:serine/threonine protein phosphatase PrpC